jgi:putative SOS response-associated peptidase YedK
MTSASLPVPMIRRLVTPASQSISGAFQFVQPTSGFQARFNAAPGQFIPVIEIHNARARVSQLRWGGTTGLRNRARARGESWLTADGVGGERYSFGIVPALGFHVWPPSPKNAGNPFFVHVEAQAVFGCCGIIRGSSCLVIAIPANPLIVGIAGEAAWMPAILEPAAAKDWLYGALTNAEDLLLACSSDQMLAYAVSARIYQLDNDDEKLIEPLETDVD